MLLKRARISTVLLAGLTLAACGQAEQPPAPAPVETEAAATTPKGYVVAEIDVTDIDAYREYVAAAFPIIQKYGGTFLTRGGTTVAVEGDEPRERVMIIEFSSLDQAKAFEFSDEYTGIAPLRQSASEGRIYLVEGFVDVDAAAP